MELTKERLEEMRQSLKQVRDRLEAQAQQTLVQLARAEGGLRALEQVLALENETEPEELDNDVGAGGVGVSES